MKDKSEKTEGIFRSSTKRDLFLLLLIAGELIYWLIMICTNSQYLHSYFHNNDVDTFMDYFNSLCCLEVPHHAIYETGVIYPAFCYCLWDIAYALIPQSYQVVGSIELRNYQPTLLGFVLFLLLMVVGLWELLKKNYSDNGVRSCLFAFSILFCGPILFAIERGNIILLALFFLLIFQLLYNSENKYFRYLSYIALALSASIKIYPALFGVLVISRKRWKEVFAAIVLGLLAFVIPFICLCGEGGEVISLFQNIRNASPILGNKGMGYNVSFINLLKIVQTFTGIVFTKSDIILKGIPACVAIFIFISNRDEWKKMFAIVLFCIWIPEFSYTYTLVFFVLPLISYLNVDSKKISKMDYIYIILYATIFLPTATVTFPEMDFAGAPYPLSGSVMIVNGAIVAFTLLLIMDGAAAMIIRRRKTRTSFISS